MCGPPNTSIRPADCIWPLSIYILQPTSSNLQAVAQAAESYLYGSWQGTEPQQPMAAARQHPSGGGTCPLCVFNSKPLA